MTVSLRIDQETGIATISCYGVLDLSAAREAAAALWAAPGWNKRAAVWDFREAEFDFSPTDARALAAYILKHQPTPPPSKIAFVTNRDVDFGMARIFGAHRDDSITAFRVFRDRDEAIDWVGITEPDAF
jgi:hypothetical protein